MKKAKDVDSYIRAYPPKAQAILKKMRQAIHEAAPKAEETISYGIPAFKLKSVLVYFAGYKDHISFFPTSSPIRAFKKELARYDISKGTIRFPLDKPIPFGLLKKIVRFRAKEDSGQKK